MAAAEAGGPSKEVLLAVVLLTGATVSLVCNPVWGAFSDRTIRASAAGCRGSSAGRSTGAAALLLLVGRRGPWSAGAGLVPRAAGAQRRVGRRHRRRPGPGAGRAPRRRRRPGRRRRDRRRAARHQDRRAHRLDRPGLPRHRRDHARPGGAVRPGLPRRAAARATTCCRRSTRRAMLRSFWVSPREHPDFAWAWLTRLLVNLGNWIALNYLYYFLTDGLGFAADDATARLGLLVLLYGATTVRHHRASSAGGATGSAAQGLRDLVRASSSAPARWSSASPRPGRRPCVAAVVLGAGFGVYQAVDFALITQVLPGGRRARQGPRRHQHRRRPPAGARRRRSRGWSSRSSAARAGR